MAKKDTVDAPLTRDDVQAMIDASLLKHDIVHGHHEPVNEAVPDPAFASPDESNKTQD